MKIVGERARCEAAYAAAVRVLEEDAKRTMRFAGRRDWSWVLSGLGTVERTAKRLKAEVAKEFGVAPAIG